MKEVLFSERVLFKCRLNYLTISLDYCEFNVSTLMFIALDLEFVWHFGIIWPLFMVFIEFFQELQNHMNDLV